jgi:hypothetical protein
MSIFQALIDCLGCDSDEIYHEMGPASPPGPPPSSDEVLKACKIFNTIQAAEKPGQELRASVNQIVHVSAWSENLAKCILHRIEQAIPEMSKMGPALREAFDRAASAATGFARDHPIYTTIIALGILAVLLPWVIEALGFAELGPVEGS